jgi:hypothetical protein
MVRLQDTACKNCSSEQQDQQESKGFIIFIQIN